MSYKVLYRNAFARFFIPTSTHGQRLAMPAPVRVRVLARAVAVFASALFLIPSSPTPAEAKVRQPAFKGRIKAFDAFTNGNVRSRNVPIDAAGDSKHIGDAQRRNREFARVTSAVDVVSPFDVTARSQEQPWTAEVACSVQQDACNTVIVEQTCTWATSIVGANNVVSGTAVHYNRPVWGLGVVWGDDLDDDIVRGNRDNRNSDNGKNDNIVWGDSVVWGSGAVRNLKSGAQR